MNIVTVLLLIVACVIGFFLQGYRKIPANPPSVAVVTIFGKRTKMIKKEGWRFFPLYPWLYGYILVDVTKKLRDIVVKNIKSPDLAEFEIPVNLTITPDSENLISYLDYKGEDGVFANLMETLEEKLRIWAIAGDEGPTSAEELLAAGDEAVEILVKAIAGAKLTKIPSPFPTHSLLKAFHKPYPKAPLESEKKFGDNWEKITGWFEKLNENEKNCLLDALKKRKDFLDQIRRGDGMIKIPSLGVILNRFNIGEIKGLGKFAEAADLMVKKRKEREAEELEIQYVADIIDKLKKQLNISNEQALEILQTERGKVVKNINESKWNISSETRAMIEKIAPDVLTGLLRKITTKGGDSNG